MRTVFFTVEQYAAAAGLHRSQALEFLREFEETGVVEAAADTLGCDTTGVAALPRADARGTGEGVEGGVNCPGLMILLPLEGAPRVWVDALNDGEQARLLDWLGSRAEFVALVARALELAEEARAA